MGLFDLARTVRCPECGAWQGKRCKAGSGYCAARWRALREFDARVMTWRAPPAKPATRPRRRRPGKPQREPVPVAAESGGEWVPIFPHYS